MLQILREKGCRENGKLASQHTNRLVCSIALYTSRIEMGVAYAFHKRKKVVLPVYVCSE